MTRVRTQNTSGFVCRKSWEKKGSRNVNAGEARESSPGGGTGAGWGRDRETKTGAGKKMTGDAAKGSKKA